VSASRRANARRMVDSPGPRPGTPSSVSAWAGWWATHSPIATNDRALASTAARPTARIAGSRCCSPRGSRGSGTVTNKLNRSGRVGVPPAGVRAGVGEDDIDGCGPQFDGRVRTPSKPHGPHPSHTPHRPQATNLQVTALRGDLFGALSFGTVFGLTMPW